MVHLPLTPPWSVPSSDEKEGGMSVERAPPPGKKTYSLWKRWQFFFYGKHWKKKGLHHEDLWRLWKTVVNGLCSRSNDGRKSEVSTYLCRPCIYYIIIILMQLSSSWPLGEIGPTVATNPKYDHITPMLTELHWLTGNKWIQFKTHDHIQGPKLSAIGIFERTASRESKHQNTEIFRWTDPCRV